MIFITGDTRGFSVQFQVFPSSKGYDEREYMICSLYAFV